MESPCRIFFFKRGTNVQAVVIETVDTNNDEDEEDGSNEDNSNEGNEVPVHLAAATVEFKIKGNQEKFLAQTFARHAHL